MNRTTHAGVAGRVCVRPDARIGVLVVGLVATVAGGEPKLPPEYTVKDLGLLDGAYAWATSLNNADPVIVVGWAYESYGHARIWEWHADTGRMTDLGFEENTGLQLDHYSCNSIYGRTPRVSNDGQVVVSGHAVALGRRPCVRSASGEWSVLTVPEVVEPGLRAWGDISDISNSGIIVGHTARTLIDECDLLRTCKRRSKNVAPGREPAVGSEA